MNPAEGRERLWEGVALVIKALTEPQPFSWEGRYYQFRTVAVWPRPVQQPLPPMVVATRSDDMLQYAAEHRLGLAVSFVPVDQMARVLRSTARGVPAGWQPTPTRSSTGEASTWRRRTAGGSVVSGCQACRTSARGHRDAACCVEGNTGGPGGRSVRLAQHPGRRCAGGRGWRCPAA